MAMPEQQFRTAVAEQIARDAWVVGGNYRGKVGDLVWRRADVVDMFSLDPQQSVIMWVWATHVRNRTRYLAAQADPTYQGMEFVRLRSHREAVAFLARLDGVPGASSR
jgi:hypothetical protein